MKHYMLGKDLISCLQLTICFYAFANIPIYIFAERRVRVERENARIICVSRWFGVGSLILSTNNISDYLYDFMWLTHTHKYMSACRNAMAVQCRCSVCLPITKHLHHIHQYFVEQQTLSISMKSQLIFYTLNFTAHVPALSLCLHPRKLFPLQKYLRIQSICIWWI